MSSADPQLVRWRLILGQAAELGLGGVGLEGDDAASDAALSWLYDREAELAGRDVRQEGPRRGGSDGSRLNVPDWINEVHRLFPKETIERLEKDAIERYQINEVVTNPEVLKRVEPNESLLQAVLRTKHLMNPEVLGLARNLVAQVVRELMEKFAMEVRRSFAGKLDPRRSSPVKIARNFDAERTIRKNLRRYSTSEGRLYIERPYFLARTRRHGTKWQVILLVDESGSMLGSVIHAAVTAACLWGLPAIRTHLCIFDTQVVDLTPQVTDPIEILMKVQLGGGTDIGKAVQYGAELIDNPRRAIVVLITDFFEGASSEVLVRRVKALCDQGTHVIGLAALDETASPNYDRELARRLVDSGAHVGAMTPGQLAAWIAEKVRT
jgi:Mg-chelatase subunit ChlD